MTKLQEKGSEISIIKRGIQPLKISLRNKNTLKNNKLHYNQFLTALQLFLNSVRQNISSLKINLTLSIIN